MKKIGVKLSVVACVLIAAAVAVVIGVTLALAHNHSDNAMQNMSHSSLSVVENEVANHIDRMENIYKNIDGMQNVL